jgi:CRISPR/Cas system-associated exonuclease Cas4 (RecB family)
VSTLETAQVLSPTQVRCFMDCHARWWFKYRLKISDPPNGNLVLGRAVHSALTQNFAQKVETYEDLPFPGVVALFREAWALEREQAEFRDDEEPSELAWAGEVLVGKYLDEVAPAIEPAAVELHVEGEIGGIRVQGFIDVLDVEGRIIDIKTAKASPSRIEPMHRFQIATYRQLTTAASGKGRLDTLVKTKTPKIVIQNFDVTEEDMRATQMIYARASEVMRSDLYLPNRLSMLCSRRNCPYWRICESEWGGEVPET